MLPVEAVAMAVFLLIRHGAIDALGKTLVGRLPGVGLNPQGLSQAERLAERLATVPIEQLFSSPLQRARQTAAPIARRLNLEVQVRAELDEIDCGLWQGRTFQELDGLPKWRQFNTFRSGTRIPGGELISEAQARMVGLLEDLRARFPQAVMALVGHGDPIKAALAYYAGISLDFMLRIEISPASVSILSITDWGPQLLCLNHTGDLPALPP